MFGIDERMGTKMSFRHMKLAEWYLQESGGDDVAAFRNRLETQRFGQAFLNSLNQRDQERLTGHAYDPFYSNNPQSVYIAIGYLVDSAE